MKKTKAVVVPDLGLHRLVEEWDESIRVANTSWALIARYVRDEGVSRPTLFHALVHVHKMKESSAHSECTRFFRFSKSPVASAALDRALNGDETIPVRVLREAAITQEKVRKSAQKQLADRASGADATLEEETDRGLAKLARDAVKGGRRDAKEFLAAAEVAFRLAVCREAERSGG